MVVVNLTRVFGSESGNEDSMKTPKYPRWISASSLVCLLVCLTCAGAADDSSAGSRALPNTLTLDEVVAEVVRQNPELDFYRAEVSAAKAGRRTAAQWSHPELTAELGSKRVWDRGGAALGDGVAWSVAMAQTFEYPGRMALRKAIANRQVELAELGLAQFQAALAARVRMRAQAALAAQQRAEATREVTQRFRALLEVLVQREPTGVTPLLDQRIIEANAIILQRRAVQADRELQGVMLELNQLRGAPAGAPLKLTGSLAAPGKPPALSALLEVAATNNFELRMRQAELAQQGFQVQLARNERYPKVTLAPFYAAEIRPTMNSASWAWD